METLSPPTFVVLKNVAAFVFGKMSACGLTNKSMREDAWDYAHITTWNFLPFLLKESEWHPPGRGSLDGALVDFIGSAYLPARGCQSVDDEESIRFGRQITPLTRALRLKLLLPAAIKLF